MTLVGFEPTISAGELLKTYALDRAAIGTGAIRTVHSDIHKTSFCIYKTDIISCLFIIRSFWARIWLGPNELLVGSNRIYYTVQNILKATAGFSLRRPGSVPSQYLWILRWINWHWGWSFGEGFFFPLSVLFKPWPHTHSFISHRHYINAVVVGVFK